MPKMADARGGWLPGLRALGEPVAERGQTPTPPPNPLDAAALPAQRRWLPLPGGQAARPSLNMPFQVLHLVPR